MNYLLKITISFTVMALLNGCAGMSQNMQASGGVGRIESDGEVGERRFVLLRPAYVPSANEYFASHKVSLMRHVDYPGKLFIMLFDGMTVTTPSTNYDASLSLDSKTYSLDKTTYEGSEVYSVTLVALNEITTSKKAELILIASSGDKKILHLKEVSTGNITVADRLGLFYETVSKSVFKKPVEEPIEEPIEEPEVSSAFARVQISIERDDFKKHTEIKTGSDTQSTKSSDWLAFQTLVLLRATIKDGVVLTSQIYVSDYDSDWRYYHSATDQNGNDLSFTKIDSSAIACRDGCTNVEDFGLNVNTDYLENTLKYDEFKIKVYGKAGSVVFTLPHDQVRAFVAAVKREQKIRN